MVRQVDLLIEGELCHASARALDRSGYRFYVPSLDGIRCSWETIPAVPQGPVGSLAARLQEVVMRARGRRVGFTQEGFAQLSVDREEKLVLVLRSRPVGQVAVILEGSRGESPVYHAVGSRPWTFEGRDDVLEFLRMLWVTRPLWVHAVLEDNWALVGQVVDHALVLQVAKGAGGSALWTSSCGSGSTFLPLLQRALSLARLKWSFGSCRSLRWATGASPDEAPPKGSAVDEVDAALLQAARVQLPRMKGLPARCALLTPELEKLTTALPL